MEAYIAGAHSDPKNPVLVTAKHFPGHGDTAEDSHIGLARLDADRERIESVELMPFRAAIAAGVDASHDGAFGCSGARPGKRAGHGFIEDSHRACCATS